MATFESGINPHFLTVLLVNPGHLNEALETIHERDPKTDLLAVEKVEDEWVLYVRPGYSTSEEELVTDEIRLA